MNTTNNNKNKKYDLEERTAKFGENVILFVKKIPQNVINKPLITQLVKSATSIGANYCEADCAESRKDFIHKLEIANKEAKETKHWLRMVAKAIPELKDEAKVLWKESTELHLIIAYNNQELEKIERNFIKNLGIIHFVRN